MSASLTNCLGCSKEDFNLWKISLCGHRICNDCASNGFNDKGCRHCREGKVVCFSLKRECTFTCQLKSKNLREHFAKCQYRLIACPNECCEVVSRKDLLTHMTSECKLKLEECEFCQTSLYRCEISGHYDTCESYPVSCQFCKLHNICRKNLPSHLEACTLVVKPCLFSDMGCQYKGTVDDRENHLRSANHGHHIAESLRKLLQEVDNLKSKVSHLEQRNEYQESQLSIYKRENEYLQHRIQATQRETMDKCENLLEKFDCLDRRTEDNLECLLLKEFTYSVELYPLNASGNSQLPVKNVQVVPYSQLRKYSECHHDAQYRSALIQLNKSANEIYCVLRFVFCFHDNNFVIGIEIVRAPLAYVQLNYRMMSRQPTMKEYHKFIDIRPSLPCGKLSSLSAISCSDIAKHHLYDGRVRLQVWFEVQK